MSDNESENENNVNCIEERDSSISDFDENDISDDNSHVIGHTENMKSVCGYEKNLKSDGTCSKKRKFNETIAINKNVDSQLINQKWTQRAEFQTAHFQLISTPFQICSIKDFIDNNYFLSMLKEEFNSLKWRKRRLDLYEFFQSDDLVNSKQKYMNQIYTFLRDTVMPWVSEATGLPLSRVSASCSAYTNGDYLLVHDDLQGDRCIAFILYLTGLHTDNTEIWKPEFGGALELFAKDETGQPAKATKSFFPEHNKFIFFQVKNDSYHQVSEVLTMDHSRLSINGWFHMDQIPLDEPPDIINMDIGLFGTNCTSPTDEISLETYINNIFLNKDTADKIQKHVEENSEISLENFFSTNQMDTIKANIKDELISWMWVGPPNRRHYEIADENTLPALLTRFLDIFKSISMFRLLQTYTDLDLVPKNEQMRPSVRLELQRWTPGCYSLMSEKSWFTGNELDLIVYISCTAEDQLAGQIMYIAREETDNEALVTISPKENTLNIIYRDEGTARIVPYISRRAQNSLLYILTCSYKQ